MAVCFFSGSTDEGVSNNTETTEKMGRILKLVPEFLYIPDMEKHIFMRVNAREREREKIYLNDLAKILGTGPLRLL